MANEQFLDRRPIEQHPLLRREIALIQYVAHRDSLLTMFSYSSRRRRRDVTNAATRKPRNLVL
jgi:hypothetical protein